MNSQAPDIAFSTSPDAENAPHGSVNLATPVAASGKAFNGTEFTVIGEYAPALFLEMPPGAAFYTDRNLFEFMTDGIDMTPSVMNRGVGSFLRRMFIAGEPGVMVKFTANQGGTVALSDHAAGHIVPVALKEGQHIIAERDTFIAGEASVNIESIALDGALKRAFTGEEIMMQKIEGPGTVFLKM